MATANYDDEIRQAESVGDGARVSFLIRSRNATQLALNAAKAKYDYMDGVGSRVVLDHALVMKASALRQAREADSMAKNPPPPQEQPTPMPGY
jgi:hypothetical protein